MQYTLEDKIPKRKRYPYYLEVVKENLRMILEELEKRDEIIAEHGYNSSKRVLADQEVKNYLEETEKTLKQLKSSFKSYVEKYRYKISPLELDDK